MQSNRADALALFFTDTFTEAQLRNLIHGIDGVELHKELPGPPISLNELAASAVEALQRHRIIDDPFFEQLKKERPRRAAEINALRLLWAFDDGSSARGHWTITIRAPYQGFDDRQLQAFIAILLQLSGDTSLTIEHKSPGSVILALRGTYLGYLRVRRALTTGGLAAFNGYEVLAPEWLATDYAELLERWRDGDEVAGETLYNRFCDDVMRFLRRLVFATQDLEDIVQNTFLACRDSKSEFRGIDEQFPAFILGFAYNKFREYLRRQKAGNRLVDAHVDAADVAEVTAEELEIGDPSAFVEQTEEKKLLLKALRRIPVDYQTLIHLSYWEEQTNPQIAAILGVPLGTVASRLRLAKQRVHDVLDAFEADRSLIESTKKSFYAWHADTTARAKSMVKTKIDPQI